MAMVGGKKLREHVERYGEGWSVEVIDMEPVAYRKLGDGYDVEVSGLNNPGRTGSANVYVWKTPGTGWPTIAARRCGVDPDEVPSLVEDMMREIREGCDG